MTELSGYVLEMLRDGADFVLYRGRQHGNPAPILVLAPATAHPAPVILERLEHEYALAAELDSRWAARPVALARHDGRTLLVLEDPGGEPLDRILGLPLVLNRFLQVAIALAAALGQVHRHGLVHKDIKPANVLLDAAGNVRLTGFGVASRMPRERQAPAPPEVIAGTLAYMAPEQTGRMNRSIDARSDLYSLGVTLYEMLTGALPFTADDPLGWVHCHIARQPTPPSDLVKKIPPPLSAVVMKLLAKTAEERYQTASGLETDLRWCLEAWKTHGRIDPFPLGAHDAADRLLISEKLYGREDQVASLLASFDRVLSDGTTELVLVSGYSGIGKSSVVNELHSALVPPRGLFAAGKFDQYKRDIPYATLAQAIQALVRQILASSEAEVSRWRDVLREAVGPNGQLIVNLIPELEYVIGKQPSLPDIPPQDAQNRFQMVFRRFLGAFAGPGRPLTLFLDDLQWLDAATLELLQYLVTEPEMRHLLLVGAYRDNEISPDHLLVRTLDSIRKAGTTVREIVLAPLELDDVCRLVADALHSEEDAVRSFAQLVHEKTGGNPFFVTQFLTALVDEGLLVFDQDATAWSWDLARIRAKGHTDNVVDFVSTKLNRLPEGTQEALKHLACLGNAAEFTTLTMLRGDSEEALHAALSEAVRAGLVFRLDSGYSFLHDRVREAAYALIPDGQRAEAHLRIGRLLAAKLSPQEVSGDIFNLVNHLNSGLALMSGADERDRAAEFNLAAGRRAKAATAYVSARRYLSIGMDLLGRDPWERRYDLAFGLWIESAESEFLNGNFEKAETLVGELLSEVTSKIDKAAAYRIQILSHVMQAEYRQAVAIGLECLRLFNIEVPHHPTRQQAQLEYEEIWKNVNRRPIENLIDLPLMTDPEKQAVLRILTVLYAPATFIDSHLFYVLVCRSANISLLYGTTEASTHIYSGLAQILGPVFHRYQDGYRFGRLAYGLAEKYGFVGTKAYFAMEVACVWARPIQTAIDFIRLAFHAATETSDVSYACYSCIRLVNDLLLQGAHLDVVLSEVQTALNFADKFKFRDAVDIIVGQQLFIQKMRGEIAASSGFNSAQRNEEEFEAELTGDRMPALVCWYWILKLQALFMTGDYAAARSAAAKAEAVLWVSESHIQSVNYCFYGALIIAALHETDTSEKRAEGLQTLRQYQKRLGEWAEANPDTFVDKFTLVAAEIARIEGRDIEAMRFYEQAVRHARQHDFIQNEGVASELAARFYAARGFETIAHAYLHNARYCYLRWGALGKVKQLDELYPHLDEEQASTSSRATIGTRVEQLDAATVIKASQALSGEIVLDKLIETLMRIAVEHAGAERGLLILFRGTEPQIAAEATVVHGKLEVTLQQAAISPTALPESVLRYVIRTRQRVILDDVSVDNLYSQDEYVRKSQPKSVLVLPILERANLVGALYLENNLTPRAFTSNRIAILELLATQAAISLENARLYADLQQENADRKRAEDELRRIQAYLSAGQGIIRTGSWAWNVVNGEVYWSPEVFSILGLDPTTSKPRMGGSAELLPAAEQRVFHQTLENAVRDRSDFAYEYHILMPDQSIKYVQSVAKPFVNSSGHLEYIGVLMDITERRRGEDALRNAQADLARVARLTTMGELAASIAHEVNQPLMAIVTNAETCLAWLARDKPDLNEARRAAERTASNGHRAGDIIRSIRALARKSTPEMTQFDINGAIQEVLVLMRGELRRHEVLLETDLLASLEPTVGDRVQLQQVILNLIANGIEAMSASGEQPRLLRVKTQNRDPGDVLIAVEDTGIGLDPTKMGRIFDAFFTTKPEGIGMGLSICRSIVEAHGGRLWASPNVPRGSVFQFTVPAAAKGISSDRPG